MRAPLSLAAGAATAAEAASRAAAVVLNTAEAFRRTDLLRTLVQKPDVCKPTTCDQEIETWSDWKHGLKNYLSVVDAKYVEEMDVIENNGYEVWRALTMEMQPSSRQRQLALVAQLSTVRFDPAKSLSEQVTRYEEIIAEYERISSLQFSEDLKITTLVQAAPAALQVQLHMSLNSETTYAKLREQLLAYERSTTRWQASSTLTLPTTSTTSQGATQRARRARRARTRRARATQREREKEKEERTMQRPSPRRSRKVSVGIVEKPGTLPETAEQRPRRARARAAAKSSAGDPG